MQFTWFSPVYICFWTAPLQSFFSSLERRAGRKETLTLAIWSTTSIHLFSVPSSARRAEAPAISGTIIPFPLGTSARFPTCSLVFNEPCWVDFQFFHVSSWFFFEHGFVDRWLKACIFDVKSFDLLLLEQSWICCSDDRVVENFRILSWLGLWLFKGIKCYSMVIHGLYASEEVVYVILKQN